MGPTMRFSASTLALVLSLVLTPCAVRADWIPNGNPIGVTDYPVHGRSPAKATGDGSGGAFVAWEGPGYGPLLLSHLAADGRTAEGWSPAGLRLHPYPWWGHTLFAAADQSGGAFILDDAVECAASCGIDPHELLAQHVTKSGALAEGWKPDGVP